MVYLSSNSVAFGKSKLYKLGHISFKFPSVEGPRSLLFLVGIKATALGY